MQLHQISPEKTRRRDNHQEVEVTNFRNKTGESQLSESEPQNHQTNQSKSNGINSQRSMFRNSLQSGLLSLFCASGLDPLLTWGTRGKGCFKRIMDDEAQIMVLEVTAAQFCTTWMSLPRGIRGTLGIRLPYLTLVVKYLKLPFCFEFSVLDSQTTKRRFRASNSQSKTSADPMLCHMSLSLSEGWNHIKVDMGGFLGAAYGTGFVEFLSLQVNANCRVRRIFCSDRWYDDEELPLGYRMPKPTAKTKSRLSK